MQYLCLIYANQSELKDKPAEWWEQLHKAYYANVGELKAKGKYVGGNPLQPVSTASTVRVRDGQRTVTDGPFAETKEQLGGYYLIDATDLDDAIAIAATIPGAKVGSIEVRPIAPIPDSVM
ncbi:MAG: YciI family protein [Acidobacteriota bacterium]